jgi:hypothetical protein
VDGGRFLCQRGLPLVNGQRLADQPEAFYLAARDIYLSILKANTEEGIEKIS